MYMSESLVHSCLKVGHIYILNSLYNPLFQGIPHFYDLEEVTSNAARICRATHSDPRCIATSITSAILVALLLQVSTLPFLVKNAYTILC